MFINKVYDNVNMYEEDGADDPQDTSGYLGQFYR